MVNKKVIVQKHHRSSKNYRIILTGGRIFLSCNTSFKCFVINSDNIESVKAFTRRGPLPESHRTRILNKNVKYRRLTLKR